MSFRGFCQLVDFAYTTVAEYFGYSGFGKVLGFAAAAFLVLIAVPVAVSSWVFGIAPYGRRSTSG